MRTRKINLVNANEIERAAQEAAAVLAKGGTIVYPTDTVYGLGANALDAAAVENIFRIKERETGKPLPVAVRDAEMARRIAIISPAAKQFLARIWPGAVTVILPRRSTLPEKVTDGKPVGLRQPRHTFVETLFRVIDFPLTATSANISGNEAALDIKTLLKQLKGRKNLPDLLIDAGSLPPTQPSTVIDLTGAEPKVVRIGPVKPDQLLALLQEIQTRR